VILELLPNGKLAWMLNIPKLNVGPEFGNRHALNKAQRIAPDGTAYGQ
jgi:hypothetical protein